MVTHNEMFLHALADRLIVFQEGNPVVYDGSYQHFLENEGWHGETATTATVITASDTASTRMKLTKKELRRQRSAIITAKTKALKPIEEGIAQAEADIARNETLVEEHNQALMEASQLKDGGRIGELSRDLHQCQKVIDKRFDTLETLYQMQAEQSAHFQEQLDRLSPDEETVGDE